MKKNRVKQKICMVIACLLLLCTGMAHAQKTSKQRTIVLVHGAWLDASSWSDVVPALKSAGYEVINVNLPGHGNDHTSYAAITLQTYVDAVKKAIGKRTNIILVGHSMGGIVVSETAEQIPAQIAKLVYIAAFLPQNGESLLQLSGNAGNKESLLGKYFRPDEKQGAGDVAKEGIRDVFAADAPDAVANKLVSQLHPDALAPFVTPASLSNENFGRIPKTYIYTLDDKAIAYDLQQYMVHNANVSKTYTLPASHTPFFSMPGIVSAILLQESK